MKPAKLELDKLEDLRKEIDDIDEAVLALLNKRILLAEQIGQLKREGHQVVLDPGRENRVLFHVSELSRHPSLKKRIPDVYKIIMEASREAQK